MTLIEVMVAGAVGMIVMIGITSFMTFQNKAVVGMRTTSSRDQLINQLNKYSGYASALTASSSFTASGPYAGFDTNAGTNFDLCINGGGTCTQGPGTFTLTDQNGVPVAGPSVAKAAVYDSFGKLCGSAGGTLPNAGCPIIAYASYTANCTAMAPTCPQAQSIDVTYTIRQASGIPIALGRLVDYSNTINSAVPLVGSGGGSVSGSGTANYITKWLSATQVGPSSRIYEDGAGRVGIGTTTPAHQFIIQGGFPVSAISTTGTAATDQAGLAMITRSDNNALSSTANNRGWSLYARGDAYGTAAQANDLGFAYWNGAGWVYSVHLDSITGNAGVATTTPQTTLDVNGGIRPGIETVVTACSVTTEGTQRYNRTLKAYEFCNGTAWVPMGGGAISSVAFFNAGGNLGVHKACFISYYWAINGGSGCSVTGSFNGVWTRGATTPGCTIACID